MYIYICIWILHVYSWACTRARAIDKEKHTDTYADIGLQIHRQRRSEKDRQADRGIQTDRTKESEIQGERNALGVCWCLNLVFIVEQSLVGLGVFEWS